MNHKSIILDNLFYTYDYNTLYLILKKFKYLEDMRELGSDLVLHILLDIKDSLKVLNEDELIIIQKRLINNNTYAEIKEDINVSSNYIDYRVKSGIEKIRKHLVGEEL